MSLIALDLEVAPPGAPDPVVRGFSLELKEGEWVALSGVNGSGKSSLALALAGLLPPLAGDVTFAGEPVAVARERGAIAVVLQEPASQLLEPTVAAEIAFTARNLDLPGEGVAHDARTWAARLGLEPELACDPRTLSAGRQQLVLMAAALVARPRLLVADEAGAYLDPEARARLLVELRREVGRGLSVLWVTQDAAEAAAADREIVLGPIGSGGEGAARNPSPDVPRVPPSGRPQDQIQIKVSPWDGSPGPHVSCAEPFQVEAHSGSVTAFVGRNGTGKSVLLSAVAGVLEVPQVEVSPVRPTPPPIFAGQYPELQMFEERVADEAVFAAVSRGMDREEALAEATRAFDRLGLSGAAFLARRAFGLSSGEKRLLQAVAALLTPASIVLLDEPTAGIDTGRRRALAALVSERALRTPVLVASQDMEWLEWAGARPLDPGGTLEEKKRIDRILS